MMSVIINRDFSCISFIEIYQIKSTNDIYLFYETSNDIIHNISIDVLTSFLKIKALK